jgi:uncharacterized membrane protein
MSLINDALKRAQEERLAPPGGMPGVPVYQKAPESTLRREIGVIVLLVVLVVLLFGGLVGSLVYLRLRPAPTPAPATPPVAVTVPAAAATPAATEPESPPLPRTPQSRYGKAMNQAKTVAGQVAGLEREGQETANDLGAQQAPPLTPPAPIPVPAAPPAPAPSGPPTVTPPPASLPALPPAAPAVPAYKLSGIIGRAPTFTALINGQMVKVHDHVGTAEVTILETTRAVLREADGKTVELTISGNR